MKLYDGMMLRGKEVNSLRRGGAKIDVRRIVGQENISQALRNRIADSAKALAEAKPDGVRRAYVRHQALCTLLNRLLSYDGTFVHEVRKELGSSKASGQFYELISHAK